MHPKLRCCQPYTGCGCDGDTGCGAAKASNRNRCWAGVVAPNRPAVPDGGGRYPLEDGGCGSVGRPGAPPGSPRPAAVTGGEAAVGNKVVGLALYT